ncbi:MAG: TRAP transporter substrate-binding protein [Hyphomicrobiales bacterium]|nr:TRAP transporter substrate-binding protein [Hyphomicrobiales bacterium]
MKVLVSIASAALSALLCLSPALAADIKVALDSPEDMEKAGSYVWAHSFTEALNASGMPAKEFPRGSLGGEAEKLDQVSQGLLEISMSDVKSAGKIDKLIFGVSLPYLFADVAHLDRAVAGAKLMDRINAATTKAGVRVLALVAVGPASGIFNTKQPVASAADMADLRMRALDENQIALFKAWGTTGTIVSWKEVPNALQTGVADGYINPIFVPVMFGHTDFIKYFTDAGVSNAIRLALASEDWYQSLSDDEKAKVEAAAEKATAANRAWLTARLPVMRKEAEAAGISVTDLSPEARAEFEKLSRGVYTDGVLNAEQVEVWVAAADAAK